MTQSEEITYLKEVVQTLLLKIDELTVENVDFRVKIDELTAENAALRARLNQNSGNIGRPPSTDGYLKKSHTAIITEGVEKKSRGGQFGHKGATLLQVENPDFVEEHKPEVCSCGHCFDASSEHTFLSKRQVFDIPPPKISVYEHRIFETNCPVCGQKNRAEFPAGVTNPTQYGDRMKSFVTLLGVHSNVPMAKIRQVAAVLYRVSLNEGTIVSFYKDFFDKLEATEKVIQHHIAASSVVNADETGIRIDKKTNWLHTYSTERFTYLFPHAKRGMEAIEAGAAFLKDFRQWLVHDGWSSYFKLKSPKHGACNAHFLRELQATIENDNRVWAGKMKDFLVKLNQMPFDERVENQVKLTQQYEDICTLARTEEPEPDPVNQPKKKGRIKKPKSTNLLERFIKYRDNVLAFAFNKEVPFTNNQAERDLRVAKIKMKVSNGFRSFDGAACYARIAGFISTAQKNGCNIFDEIHNTLRGYNFLVGVGK
jgi:transposase